MNRFEKRIRTADYICLITATLSMVYLLGCHREASTTPTLDIVVLWLYIAIRCLSCWLLIILRKKGQELTMRLNPTIYPKKNTPLTMQRTKKTV